MKIIDIRAEVVAIPSPIRNAAIDYAAMTTDAVAVVTDVIRDGHPVIGYGLGSIGRYATAPIIQARLAPRILAAPPDRLIDRTRDNLDPDAIWAAAMRNEKAGGHGERAGAMGVLDTAIWDAVAKIEERPLWRVLADRYHDGKGEERVFVYGSGGHYDPNDDLGRLRDEISAYAERGYELIKIKVGGAPLADDIARIEAAIDVLGTPSRLAVDANAGLDRGAALALTDALARYGLRWIEEPGDPLDYDLLAELCVRYPGALATGENMLSLTEARNLIRYGGLRPDRDILQIDIALAYGLVEYVRILGMLAEAGWSRRRCIPHAGHLLALHAAAGLGLGGCEAAPDPALIYGGFPEGCTVANGTVNAPELPGIGFEAKPNMYAVLAPLTAF